jgi:hypothetical protein
MEKPRLRDRLFFALVCYAMVLAWVAVVFTYVWLTPGPGVVGSVEAGVVVILFFTLPIPGALIGLGTGALLSRGGDGGLGAIIGFALALFIQLAFFAAWQ